MLGLTVKDLDKLATDYPDEDGVGKRGNYCEESFGVGI